MKGAEFRTNRDWKRSSLLGRAFKSIGHSHMECGGKRSATPLWLVSCVSSEDEALKPKRRRASLAAALHNVPEREGFEFRTVGASRCVGRCSRGGALRGRVLRA